MGLSTILAADGRPGDECRLRFAIILNDLLYMELSHSVGMFVVSKLSKQSAMRR